MTRFRAWFRRNVVGDAPADMGRTSVLDVAETVRECLSDDTAAERRVRIYPFHASYPGLPDLFHVACDRHPEFGFCGDRDQAHEAAVEHIENDHLPRPHEATAAERTGGTR